MTLLGEHPQRVRVRVRVRVFMQWLEGLLSEHTGT